MANEVIITTYKTASIEKGLSHSVLGDMVGGEVLDIGTASGLLSGELCVIRAKGAGFWYNRGASGVSATADTGGNDYLADGDALVFDITRTSNYIDTAA